MTTRRDRLVGGLIYVRLEIKLVGTRLDWGFRLGRSEFDRVRILPAAEGSKVTPTRRMITAAKKAILGFVDRLGYTILKKSDRVQYGPQIEERERELLAARTEIVVNDYPRLKAQRDFYSNQMIELQTHNRVLTETATQNSLRLQENALRVQELERELRTEIAANGYPRLKAERDFLFQPDA